MVTYSVSIQKHEFSHLKGVPPGVISLKEREQSVRSMLVKEKLIKIGKNTLEKKVYTENIILVINIKQIQLTEFLNQIHQQEKLL